MFGGVRTGKLMYDAMCFQETGELSTSKFPTRIGSQSHNLSTQQILNHRLELSKHSESFRLVFKRKEPAIFGEIINKNDIVAETVNRTNW
ncbi:hypothetical protein C1H46_000694 [Malus baccata]|uniref:Uncharacterized protein n=1 Tax=Malus baccata TaxID=106549 RepID=A0A540NRN0_MALBA|nr:hypothetical protein C1H46_000694 [Malus baccata]